MATKAKTTAHKRAKKRVLPNKEQLKKAQPALGDLGGAVAGGVIGAFAPPAASGIGGVVLLVAGAYTKKSWLTSAGAAMVVTTVTGTGANQRVAPGGKTDLKTEMHNGKERVKTFLKSFGGKFTPWKKKQATPDAPEALDGLGSVDAANLAALDQLNRDLIAQGYELVSVASLPVQYPMVHPGTATIY